MKVNHYLRLFPTALSLWLLLPALRGQAEVAVFIQTQDTETLLIVSKVETDGSAAESRRLRLWADQEILGALACDALYLFKLEKAGFAPFEVERYLDCQAQESLIVEFPKLEEAGTGVTIRTLAGADVTVYRNDNGNETPVFRKTSDDDGLVALPPRMSGAVSVRVAKPGYETMIFPFVEGLPSEPKPLSLLGLKAEPATVVIRSVPSGATVVVDGEEVGSTPLELKRPPSDDPFVATVFLDGFSDGEALFPNLQPGVRREQTIALSALKGMLNVRLVAAETGEVVPESVQFQVSEFFIDNRPYDWTGRAIGGVGEGKRSIFVNLPPYFKSSLNEVEIDEAGKSVTIELDTLEYYLTEIATEPSGVPFSLLHEGNAIPKSERGYRLPLFYDTIALEFVPNETRYAPFSFELEREDHSGRLWTVAGVVFEDRIMNDLMPVERFISVLQNDFRFFRNYYSKPQSDRLTIDAFLEKFGDYYAHSANRDSMLSSSSDRTIASFDREYPRALERLKEAFFFELKASLNTRMREWRAAHDDEMKDLVAAMAQEERDFAFYLNRMVGQVTPPLHQSVKRDFEDLRKTYFEALSFTARTWVLKRMDERSKRYEALPLNSYTQAEVDREKEKTATTVEPYVSVFSGNIAELNRARRAIEQAIESKGPQKVEYRPGFP